MRKKISLLLAFIGRPALITLDEPMVTLDRPGETALHDLIRERHQHGTGFVLSSHQILPVLPGVREIEVVNKCICLI